MRYSDLKTEYADFFYDTEFLEEGYGSPIYPISIGMVHGKSGASYYAVNADMPVRRIKKHKWLMENVWPYLPTTSSGGLNRRSPLVKPREQIAEELSEFVAEHGFARFRSRNRLWAYYCSYDHVVLSQLYGRMLNLPSHMPMFTHDLKVEGNRQLLGDQFPEQESGLHDALADAKWNVEVARFLGII